jgi:hypothetical protein
MECVNMHEKVRRWLLLWRYSVGVLSTSVICFILINIFLNGYFLTAEPNKPLLIIEIFLTLLVLVLQLTPIKEERR